MWFTTGRRTPSTLWSLVADSLLKWLSKQGVFAQGFADDGGLLLIGKALNILCEVMQRILHGVEKWCMDIGQSCLLILVKLK